MKKLNWLKIASLYIGTIMGAGFASGRECWQYFGVFGNEGYKGVIIVTLGFIILSLMMSYIAVSKASCDIGKIVSPFDNHTIENALGIVLAIDLYCVIISMSAAGGSLLEQQFGISRIFGGLLIIVLTVYTVLGNFKRISTAFSFLVPVLFFITLFTIILVISYGFRQSGKTTGFEAGGMSPTWIVSAFVYLSYNSLGMIAISGNTAVNSKNKKNLYLGALAGTAALGFLIFIILKALLCDMEYSNNLDLPMLGFAQKISPVLNIIYAIVLYFAIYSAASSAYYACTTKLPEGKNKNILIIILAFVAFLIGLVGFTTLVEFLYSIMGYVGLVYIGLIVANFVVQFIKNTAGNNKNSRDNS